MHKKNVGVIAAENHVYRMLKAAKILDQQVMCKFPGINMLAASCQISSSKLKRDFKKVHGLTPLEYFRSQQILYVTDLLKTNEKTAKELAITFGFKKVSTFSAWYRKISNNDAC